MRIKFSKIGIKIYWRINVFRKINHANLKTKGLTWGGYELGMGMGQLKVGELNKRPFINTYGSGLQLNPISPIENKQMGMGQLKMGKQNKGPFINTNGLGLQLKPISQNLGSPPTRPTAQNISHEDQRGGFTHFFFKL